MLTIAALRELFRHMEWADALMWHSLLASPIAADSTLRTRLIHIHAVQRWFLHMWREEPLPDLPGPSTFPDLRDIAVWGREYHEELVTYVKSLKDSALDRTIEIPWADKVAERFGRPAQQATLRETMFQVVNHSSHHRGQVNTALRELGGEPLLVDFIVWVWLGKPNASWTGLQ